MGSDTRSGHTGASAWTPPHLSSYVGIPAMEGGARPEPSLTWDLIGVRVGEMKTCKMLLWCGRGKPNQVK